MGCVLLVSHRFATADWCEVTRGEIMPFLYVYSPSDFVGGLPDEAGAAASGSPMFTLTLIAGATPTLIEVTDDEIIFDEVDGSQVLTDTVNIDGTTVTAGTSINTAYDLINTTTGHKVTSFHFGGDGYQQGAVDGIVSTVSLQPGTSYTFNTERTSHQKNNEYEDYVACFTGQSMIKTDTGLVAIKDLKVGDMVQTLDHGFQPLRMILTRQLSSIELIVKPNLRPVLVTAGALGKNIPEQDLLVSAQHRFLANSPVVERMFGEQETLISATKLTALAGIDVSGDFSTVTYYHLVLDQHEIVFVEGAPTESYYCGPMAISGLNSEARKEIETLFPEIASDDFVASQARGIPSSKRQTQFVMRHEKNQKPILVAAFDGF